MNVIYLDHAATAYPRHPAVGEAMLEALSVAGNVGRGGHGGAAKGTSIVGTCRERLANLLGARDAARMFLFPSATTALNTVIDDLARDRDQGRLLIGPLEHNAVTRPAARRFGDSRIARLPSGPGGLIDVDALDDVAIDDVVGVIVQHASNVCGTVQPIEEIGTWCAEYGIPFFVDGAQAAGLVPFRIDEIPALRAYTTAGHKNLGGPPGVGVAYFAVGYEPEPLWIGGNGVRSEDASVPTSGPGRYECGTANLPGIAGLAAALGTFDRNEVESRWNDVTRTRARWITRLRELPGVELFGEGGEAERTAVISVRVAGYEPAAASRELEERAGVRTRAGLHCAPDAHRFLETLTAGTLRFAPGPELTEEDFETVFTTLKEMSR